MKRTQQHVLTSRSASGSTRDSRSASSSTILTRPALALTLGCVLALAACGDRADPDGSSPTAAEETAPEETVTEEATTEQTTDATAEETSGPEGSAGPTDEDPTESTPVEGPTGDEPTGDNPTDTPDGTTEVVALQVFGADGYSTADWTIEDRSDEPPFDCWSMSGAVLEGLGYMCGATVDYGVGCLDNPLADDEVICVTDPIAQTGYRDKVGERPSGERTQFIPLTVQLADGGVFRMRAGGAGAENPDGLVTFYYCQDRCEGAALWGVAGEDGVNNDTDAWTALIAPEDGSESAQEVPVTRAWMLVGTGIG